MSASNPTPHRQRALGKIKKRLMMPISAVSFPSGARMNVSRTKSDDRYLGGVLPVDPFARGPPVRNVHPRIRTESAPSPPNHAPPHVTKPPKCTSTSFPQTSRFPSKSTPPTSQTRQSASSSVTQPDSGRLSPCETVYYSCYGSDNDSSDNDDKPAVPTTRPARRRLRTRELEALLEVTDDETAEWDTERDGGQFPGAYFSSATLFSRAAAQEINPLSLPAANAAYARRAISTGNLRNVARAPPPPQKVDISPFRRTVRVYSTGESRPPSYSSQNDRVPSYLR